jgi:hypothetical protein
MFEINETEVMQDYHAISKSMPSFANDANDVAVNRDFFPPLQFCSDCFNISNISTLLGSSDVKYSFRL